jgi:hypothetical protein
MQNLKKVEIQANKQTKIKKGKTMKFKYFTFCQEFALKSDSACTTCMYMCE